MSSDANNFDNLKYMTGFGNEFKSEDPRCPRALPEHQNSPQVCPYGLYAEHVSGTSFTASRKNNQRTWMYRILPSCQQQQPSKPMDNGNITHNWAESQSNPSPMKWDPFEMPSKKHDFVQGMSTVCGSGHPRERQGCSIYVYTCNTSMQDKCMSNNDGDMVIVPQQGKLKITTECGKMTVEPDEICVIQRGMRFNVCVDGPCRGYIAEVMDGHFCLPDMGMMGANGAANPRDFEVPCAWYEDRSVQNYQMVQKHQGQLHCSTQNHSPFDVVAWHGNYVPYKYNLNHFMAMNSVNYDHADPSVYTVLSCRSNNNETPVCDVVCFPPRWSVAEHTFRPPYYHRNAMTEFMGCIRGKYEAKDTMEAGCATLVPMMSAHGPDAACYKRGSTAKLAPERVAEGSMAFMFETGLEMNVTKWAMSQKMDQDYCNKSWQDLKKNFNPNQKPPQ